MRLIRSAVCLLLAPAGLVSLVRSQAQAIPSGTSGTASTSGTATASGPSVGFGLPTVRGSLNYAVTASEVVTTGFYQGNGANAFTNIGGNLAYITQSEAHPFSVIYSGGYLLSTGNQSSSFYQNLSFSQVLNTPRWNIVASDAVSYLPSGATVGLSGVAGVGDLGVPPAQVGPQNGLGILTDYAQRVSNSTTLSVSRRLTGHIAVQGSGSLTLLRFTGNNSQYGLNNTGYSGSGGVTYLIDARSSVNANYSYSHFFFNGTPFAFDTHSGTIGYNRQLRRALSFSVYAGPQVAVSTQPGLNYSSGLGLTAGATLGYQAQLFVYSLNYSRGINSGSGVIAGSTSDSASVTASHQFGRAWNTSGSLSYTRSASLPQLSLYSLNTNALAAAVQVSRSFTRTLSGYGSYALVRQSTSGSVPVNTFSGLYQVVGFGLTYSPQPIRLSR